MATSTLVMTIGSEFVNCYFLSLPSLCKATEFNHSQLCLTLTQSWCFTCYSVTSQQFLHHFNTCSTLLFLHSIAIYLDNDVSHNIYLLNSCLYQNNLCHAHLLNSINQPLVHSAPINNVQNLYICRINHVMEVLQTLFKVALIISVYHIWENFGKLANLANRTPFTKCSSTNYFF